MSRHPGTVHLMDMLQPNDKLPEKLREISETCYSLAHETYHALEDGPELTAGLRKLLEAKDCFVRQALVDSKKNG